MSKQTSKHTHRLHLRGHTIVHPSLEKVGAIILTVVSVLVSFETIVEHHSKHEKVDKQDPHLSSQIFARTETTKSGETARLPEDFDIGLQTPHVSGL
jgi:hypothetical protein